MCLSETHFNIAWFRLLKLPKDDQTTQCHFQWAGAKHFGNLPLTLLKHFNFYVVTSPDALWATGNLSRCGSECS